VAEGHERRVDPVLEGRPVVDQVEPEPGPLPFGADGRVRQPDRGHEVPAAELGEDPGIDPVGLGSQWRDALDLEGIGDLDVPAEQLELVVDEAGPGHRLDGRGHRLPVAADHPDQRPEGIPIGADGGHLHGPAILVEHVHIEPLARKVQSGVQHVLGLLIGWFLREPTLPSARPFFMAFIRSDRVSRADIAQAGGPRSRAARFSRRAGTDTQPILTLP
jgi:hypothetical protein